MTNEYLISRKGSNAANQHMQETRPLLLLDAENQSEARSDFDAIWSSSVTVYANQQIIVERVDDLEFEDDDEYLTLQEIDEENRRCIDAGHSI